MKTVVGMFNTTSEAQRTIEELTQLGFGPKDISVVTPLSAKDAIGAKLDLKPLDVSDLGRVAACGPLAESLEKADPNGLTATLQYYGLSPKLAEHYALGVQHGETLETLTVEDNDADRVVAIMERHARMEREAETRAQPTRGVATAGTIAAAGIASNAGASRAEQREGTLTSAAPRATSGNGRISTKRAEHIFGVDEELRIPIVREELRVGKREVERGGVRVSVHVKETPVTEQIHLREEHVEIERHLVDRAPLPGEATFRGEELSFEEYAEEPVISKEARVVEEIVVHKRVTERDEIVNDKIRATEVSVDPLIGFDRGDYERHFSSLNVGGSFDDYLPAYELGHKLRASGARSWEELENDAQKHWEDSHPGTWQRFKDTVRYAWARARMH